MLEIEVQFNAISCNQLQVPGFGTPVSEKIFLSPVSSGWVRLGPVYSGLAVPRGVSVRAEKAGSAISRNQVQLGERKCN